MTTVAPGRSRDRAASVRLLGRVTTAVAVLAAALLAGLDLLLGLPPGVGSTISAYVFTDGEWAFQLAIAALIIGCAALVAGVIRARLATAQSFGTVLLLIAGISLVVLLVFPKTDWSQGDSWHGQLHRLASLVAFIGAPLGIITLAARRRAGESAAATALRRAALTLAVVALLWLAPLVFAAARMVFDGPPWWHAVPLGLMERGIVFSEIAATAAMGLWLVASTGARSAAKRLAGPAAATAPARP